MRVPITVARAALAALALAVGAPAPAVAKRHCPPGSSEKRYCEHDGHHHDRAPEATRDAARLGSDRGLVVGERRTRAFASRR
jgi:hypothetical protein